MIFVKMQNFSMTPIKGGCIVILPLSRPCVKSHFSNFNLSLIVLELHISCKNSDNSKLNLIKIENKNSF